MPATTKSPKTTKATKPTSAPRQPSKLSKTRYLSGLQCHLKLWYDCYERQLAGPTDAATQAIFDTGHAVGELATKRHPGGVLIDAEHYHYEQAAAQTKAAMADKRCPALFEAGFEHADLRVRVDILARGRGRTWDLVEVKSATKVKDTNVDDLAVQYWVLRNAGLELGRAGILTLNRDYVYAGGAYDVEHLFAFHELGDEVERKQSEVADNVRAVHAMLRASRPPHVEPGEHCSAPYECPYYAHCTRDLEQPDHPFGELPGLHANKRAALAELGAVTVHDVPADFPLNELQARVRLSVKSGQPFVSPALGAALAKPVYPIHHLDFETCMFALPRYKGTRPYQTLPFQWSNHIESARGEVRHEEYLCREDKDPRAEFAATLLASLADEGTICVYTTYEVRVIRELAEALPRLRARLLALEERVWDLCAAIRAHYYHPRFHGSFSLKQVLPVMVPRMSYDGLMVQDGEGASRAYVEAIESKDEARRRELWAALVEYCGQDTEAMVKLRGALGLCVAA